MPDYTLSAKITGDSSDYEKAVAKAQKITGELEKNISQKISKANKNTGKSLAEIAAESGKTVNQLRSDVMKAAAEYRKTGLSMSEAMKKAYADIGYSAKDAENKSKSAIKGIGVSIDSLSGKLKTGLSVATKAIAAVAAGIGTVSAATIKIGSDFEAQMSRVQAISGATGAELQSLRDQAIQLGADTSFSASEAAQGMENLAAAGFTTTEIMDAMPGLLDMAAASGEDLAASSDIAASTLRGFGLAASDAGHVADVLAENANRTNSSIAETGEAMKYIAPLARAAGISLEETAAAIGIMANAGIQGSQAGTTLRGALSRLSKPTDDMVDVMDELGISFYDSEGKMKSLTDQVGMLRTATAGMTDEQRNNALVTLYGQESLSGMLALINEGEGSLAQLTESFETCDGAAQSVAATMQDNLQGAIEQMKGSLETLGIVIYDSVSAPLKDLAQDATEIINELTTAFQERGSQGLIEAGGGIVANVLLGIAQAAPSIITMATQLIQSIVTNLNTNLPQIMAAGGQILTALVSGVLQVIFMVGGLALNIVGELVSGLISNAPQLTAQANTMMTDFCAKIRERFPDLLQSGADAISSLLMGLLNNAPSVIEQGGTMITTFVDTILSMLPQILQAGGDIALNLLNGIVANAPDIIHQAAEISINFISMVKSHLPQILQTGVELIGELLAGIIRSAPDIIAAIPGIIYDVARTFLSYNWGSVGSDIIAGIARGIANAGGAIVDAAVDAAKSAFNAAKDFLGINSPSTLFRDEVGRYMALGMGVGFETNIPIDDIKGGLDGAVNQISRHYTEVGQRINPVEAITGMSRVAETYQADVSNIFEGVTIVVDNTTNLDGAPIYQKASEYTIRRIGNQQRAVLKAKGAYA